MTTPRLMPVAHTIDEHAGHVVQSVAASARHAGKVYGTGETAVAALDDVTLDLPSPPNRR